MKAVWVVAIGDWASTRAVNVPIAKPKDDLRRLKLWYVSLVWPPNTMAHFACYATLLPLIQMGTCRLQLMVWLMAPIGNYVHRCAHQRGLRAYDR